MSASLLLKYAYKIISSINLRTYNNIFIMISFEIKNETEKCETMFKHLKTVLLF